MRTQALLAAGGSKGKLGIWNTLECEEVQAKLPGAHAAIGEDGRVLSGAVAGLGALDVNSSEEEEEDEDVDEDGVPATKGKKAAKPKKKTQTAFKPIGMDDEEDYEDDEDDADEEEGVATIVEDDDSAVQQRATVAARVAAAATLAGKKARRSQASFGKVKVGKK